MLDKSVSNQIRNFNYEIRYFGNRELNISNTILKIMIHYYQINVEKQHRIRTVIIS